MDKDSQSKKEYIEKQFEDQVGYFPNIDNPKTFNEKIQWLKLYYRDPLITQCADKYAARQYVKEKIGEEYLIPLLDVYDNANKIDFGKLPDKFVLKLNNSSGKNIICKNKNKLNITKTKETLKEWLDSKSNLYFYSYEWAYKNIKSKIVCEKYIEEKNHKLKDYRILCFHGKPKYIWVDTDSLNGNINHKRNIFDTTWKEIDLEIGHPKNLSKEIKKPKKIKEMLKIATILSKDFPLVRVDLYNINEKIYFGELTFYSQNGMAKFEPKEWDYKMGEYLDISKINKNKIKEKKIIITFFSHSSQLAGGERSMIELVKELKEKNIFSHVVLPNEGPLQKELENINVPYDIVSLNWWASNNTQTKEEINLKNKISTENLINYLPKLSLINPDLIYSNTMVLPWGAIAANQLNKPHIWHIREYGDLDHLLKFDLGYKETIKFIEDSSDLIITNSKSVSEHISKYLNYKKPEVVYNYVEISKKYLEEEIKNPYEDKDSLKVIICGNIQPGKNQLEGIKAVNKLIKKNINVELLILGTIGDNQYLNEILDYIKTNKIKNNVAILDFVKNPYPFIKKSDIVLIPSIKEAYGRTAVEGMLLQKVVVASDGGGTKEIIKNGETGFVYKSGNIEELEEVLTKLTDKKNQNKISQNGFNSLKEFNSRKEYGYKIANLIKKTIQKPSTKNYFNKINNEIIKSIQNEKEILKQENINLKYKIKKIKINREILKLEQSLKVIRSSKFFKIWRIYCKLLKGKK